MSSIQDLQRELINNALQSSGPVASVQFSEDKQRQRIQQRTGACVYNKHMLQSDERSTQHHVIPAPSTSFHFIPDNQVPQFQAPNSPVTSDVFQLAPFKPPEKQSKKAFSSSSFSASHKPVEASDVFLQAPFGKRQEATKANAHIFKSVTQQIQTSKHSPQVPLCAPQPLGVRAPHQPLLQQPVAVHRVVPGSRLTFLQMEKNGGLCKSVKLASSSSIIISGSHGWDVEEAVMGEALYKVVAPEVEAVESQSETGVPRRD
ncbi:hypothetical protein INR49_015235 [Caranx melampygus]|nr:hypothetical protein INR49_015235 [Caranx melampygus]